MQWFHTYNTVYSHGIEFIPVSLTKFTLNRNDDEIDHDSGVSHSKNKHLSK